MKAKLAEIDRHQDMEDLEPILLEHVSWDTYEMLVRERDAAGQHFKITYDRGSLEMESPLLEHASWELYERLLHELDGQHIRITYDRGRMWLMSPFPIHDRMKKLIGRIIEEASLEQRVPISSFGSTTWRRRRKTSGLEADECYYIQHEPQVRGRFDIDLSKDPPPDLAVEVEITHQPVDRLAVYAGLKIPEIWRYDGKHMTFLHLRGEAYEPVERSGALPFVTPRDVERFLEMAGKTDENSVMAAVRDWAREG